MNGLTKLLNDVAADLEQRACTECNGTGSMCWCCMTAIDDCECGPDQEPAPCESCDGSGLVGLDPDRLREDRDESSRIAREDT